MVDLIPNFGPYIALIMVVYLLIGHPPPPLIMIMYDSIRKIWNGSLLLRSLQRDRLLLQANDSLFWVVLFKGIVLGKFL